MLHLLTLCNAISAMHNARVATTPLTTIQMVREKSTRYFTKALRTIAGPTYQHSNALSLSTPSFSKCAPLPSAKCLLTLWKQGEPQQAIREMYKLFVSKLGTWLSEHA